MPQDSDTGEKTEEPTGKKISDAVSRGNIAKSADINTAALGSCVAVVVVAGWSALGRSKGLSRSHLCRFRQS